MDPLSVVIVVVFCLIAGFVDAVAGGGGLVSLPGYYLAGYQAHEAIGTNKINALLASLVATISYARLGYIAWRLAIPCALVGLIGSACGAAIALAIPSRVFTLIMVVLIPLTAIYLFRSKAFSGTADDADEGALESNRVASTPSDSSFDRKHNCTVKNGVSAMTHNEPAVGHQSATDCESLCVGEGLPHDRNGQRNPVSLVKALVASAVLGAYDGFYGPGSGTFLLILFTGFAGMTINEANGVSKIVICATNLAGITVFFFGGHALILLGLIAGVSSMVGSAIGAHAFSKGGLKLVKPLILVVLAIFFVRVIWDLALA